MKVTKAYAIYPHESFEGLRSAPIAHCLGLKNVENGDKSYDHIAIRDIPEDHNTLRERDIRFNRK